MILRHASIQSRPAHLFDITVKSGGNPAKPFAPSPELLWPLIEKRRNKSITSTDLIRYRAAYVDEMRHSYGRNQAPWIELLRREEACLGCYCHSPEEATYCHRVILAWLLMKVASLHHLAVDYRGEITEGPRVAVVGSREHPDAVSWSTRVVECLRLDGCLVSGDADGVDRAAQRAAMARGIMVVSLPCTKDMWDRMGQRAGMVRNGWIEGASDAVIAMPWGKASGTKGMIELTRRAGKPLFVIESEALIAEVPAFLRHLSRTNSPTVQAGFSFR